MDVIDIEGVNEDEMSQQFEEKRVVAVSFIIF